MCLFKWYLDLCHLSEVLLYNHVLYSTADICLECWRVVQTEEHILADSRWKNTFFIINRYPHPVSSESDRIPCSTWDLPFNLWRPKIRVCEAGYHSLCLRSCVSVIGLLSEDINRVIFFSFIMFTVESRRFWSTNHPCNILVWWPDGVC